MKRMVDWEANNAYVDKSYQGNPKQLGGTNILLAIRRKKSMDQKPAVSASQALPAR